MRALRFSRIGVCFALAAMIFLAGCNEQQQIDSLKLQNRTQSQRISELEAQLNSATAQACKLQEQLDALYGSGKANIQSRDAEIKALEDALAKKNALISEMQAQLLKSGAKLPMELSIMLQEFAQKSDMVTFDEATGCLKFKSDLLFQPGSDIVNDDAAKAIAQLSEILKGAEGSKFDVIVAGHTDDMKIGKPSTRAKHPTNWHLSAHRAISVLNQMSKNGIDSKRMSVRGFGEFRPLEPNKPNKKGNPKNRRVEIFVVPQGA